MSHTFVQLQFCKPTTRRALLVRPDRLGGGGGFLFGARPARLSLLPRSAPAWNPQNVPNPQVMPSAEFSAEEAVRVQLDALQRNNEPWPNHGVQTAYEFGHDIGGLDPSWYFGFRKDLYHQDHFMGQFLNQLPELVNCCSYSIQDVQERSAGGDEGPDAVVVAQVVDSSGQSVLAEFQLKRRTFGSKKGAFMTSMLRKMQQPT